MKVLYALLLYGFVAATFVQLFLWLYYFRKLASYARKEEILKPSSAAPPVSLIICARNEEENLQQNLPRILNQSYRSLEILIVNDNSSDTTEEVVQKFQHINTNLHLFSVENKRPRTGKKPALEKGIKAAKHDVLLFTDADCSPTTENWTEKMLARLSPSTDIILGYAPYRHYPGFLNKFIRYETFFTALQYFSFALAGHPYMGVGRNLLYRKKLFFQVNGFKDHQHIMSGDDDLFINQVATAHNTRIVLDKDTHVFSEPARSWSAYYRQKSRHLSTGRYYRLKHKFLLGTVSFSHFCHYGLGFLLLILKVSTIFVTSLIVIRILVLILICKPILRKLQDRHLTPWIPVLDAVYVLFYVIFSISLIKGKIKQWT